MSPSLTTRIKRIKRIKKKSTKFLKLRYDEDFAPFSSLHVLNSR